MSSRSLIPKAMSIMAFSLTTHAPILGDETQAASTTECESLGRHNVGAEDSSNVNAHMASGQHKHILPIWADKVR